MGSWCNGEMRTQLARAVALAQIACDRTKDHGTEARCGALDRAHEMAKECRDLQVRREQSERELAAMRAQTTAIAVQGLQQIAASANGVAAANAGYVPAYTPGAPVTSTTPSAYVNPRTGAQWSSGNLALIAGLVPGGVKQQPNAVPSKKASETGTQGSGDTFTISGNCSDECTKRCKDDKEQCAKGEQHKCYDAAACLCECHKSFTGGCGSEIPALDKCIQENRTKSAALRGNKGTQVSKDPPPPKPPPPPKTEKPQPQVDNCKEPCGSRSCCHTPNGWICLNTCPAF
jgi:hypothetical protein